MKVSTHIDWVTATSKNPIDPLFGETMGERIRGVSNYDYGHETDFCRYYYGHGNQGNMVVMSGDNLDFARKKVGLTDSEIIGIVKGYKCTRIDYAMDLYDSGLSSKMLESMLLSGVLNPRSRTFTLISDPLGVRGDTLYIGSRKSVAKLFRGYEKSKKEGDQLGRFRLELQIGKDGGSGGAMSSLSEKESDQEISCEMIGVIGAFLNHDDSDSELKSALSEIPVKYKVENKTDTNTREWLEKVALPCLIKEMKNDPEFSDNVVRFINDSIQSW